MAMTQGAKLMAMSVANACHEQRLVFGTMHEVTCWLENEGVLHSCRHALVMAQMQLYCMSQNCS